MATTSEVGIDVHDCVRLAPLVLAALTGQALVVRAPAAAITARLLRTDFS